MVEFVVLNGVRDSGLNLVVEQVFLKALSKCEYISKE
jgi:hypothetical protein